MIPRILHQTWKTDRIPERFQPWVDSWARHNPDWTRMFWNDRTLLDFVGEHYPDFVDTFCGYPSGIFRADAGRYLLLHHFGGVYADLDCECVAPFDPIMGEDRVVLCKEPALHEVGVIPQRGLPHLLFNGTMVSPAKHPFWVHVADCMLYSAHSGEVLDATGPCLLTSAQASYPDQDRLVIHPPKLFAPTDHHGRHDASPENERVETLSVHHWAGTWLAKPVGRKFGRSLKKQFYRAKYYLTRGAQSDEQELQGRINPEVLRSSAPKGGNVAVLVPLRDAVEHIEPFLNLIGSLDYPGERIKLVFCEGDSKDGSWDRLQAAIAPLCDRYRNIVLLQKGLRTKLDRVKRHKPRFQRERRTGLAKVRNHILKHGLDDGDDWALWIDIDVWKFPPDILQTLLSTGHRIVTPNCVKVAAGPSFDLNNFLTISSKRDYQYYRWVKDGLYQPPSDFWGRLHLSDLRHLEKVELHGVGGTMLLVDAALHRAGLLFPEKPYKDLVETEGFGVLARDVGVTPVGLPQVEIFHVPW